MASSSRTLGEYFETFGQEAFRLETLDDYGKSGNTEAFQTFLAGKPQPENYNERWVAELRKRSAGGKRIYRVHVLSRPLTPYLQYELGWAYWKNMTGGEEFFILDTTEQPNPFEGVPDFWLFDSELVAVLNYDGEGGFLGPEELPADRAQEFIAHREKALALAEPFPDWWAKHGQ
ncbi:DUF6879 family protein [Streptomyces sp. NPDC050161]|uniref:DUF6879 family protein n=1 Tax=Streptomyces sp. NPDC050161 TaxID=3365604 RepID=UPI0037B62A47